MLAAASGCRSSRDYLAEADRLFAARKYPDATLLYRKAIQEDPRSAEAYYKLGQAQRAEGSYAAAYDSFVRAVTLNPELDQAQIELGNLYLGAYLMETTKSDVVHQRISNIAGRLLKKNPHSFAGLRFRGYLALSDRKADEAISFFRQAHDADPAQADVVLGLTQALLLAGRYPEARQTAIGLIEAHKTFGSVYDVLYAYEMSAGHASDAESLLKLKITNNPQDRDSVLQLAEHYWRTGRHAQAFQLLDAMLRENRIPWRTYASVAGFYEQNREWERSVEALTLGIRAHPDEQRAFAGAKAHVLASQGNPKEAIGLLADALQKYPEAADLKTTRALLLLESSEAADRALALRDLQSLAQAASENMTTTFQLGRAYSLNGLPDQAARQFEQVVRSQPSNVAALVALAQLSSAARKFERSLQYSEQVLNLQPGSRDAQLLHATALVGLDRLAEAQVEYNRLIREQPAYTEARLQLGLLDVLLKRFPEAEKIFHDLYNPKAGDFRALEGMVALYEAQGQTDKSLALLNGELARFPDSIAVTSLLAPAAARAGKVDLAIQQYERLIAAHPNDQEVCTQLGELYERKRDLARSLAMFQKAADLAPSDWAAMARLAAAQQESGLAAQAKANYRHAIELGADDPDVFNNLAYLEAESGTDLDDALALSQRALFRSPGNSQYADTVGFIYLKKHDNANALQVFQTLAERFPNDPAFRYHLALALLESGKREQGERELRTAVAADPSLADNATVRHLLGTN